MNNTSSAIQLRYDIDAADLPGYLKKRIKAFSDKRITSDGEIVLKAQNARSQHRNREDAIIRLRDLLREAIYKPKPRKETRPSYGAKQRRMDNKSHRGRIKSLRGRVKRPLD